MRYLLDSHILIWVITDSERLPVEAYRIINDPRNEDCNIARFNRKYAGTCRERSSS